VAGGGAGAGPAAAAVVRPRAGLQPLLVSGWPQRLGRSVSILSLLPLPRTSSFSSFGHSWTTPAARSPSESPAPASQLTFQSRGRACAMSVIACCSGYLVSDISCYLSAHTHIKHSADNKVYLSGPQAIRGPRQRGGGHAGASFLKADVMLMRQTVLQAISGAWQHGPRRRGGGHV